MRRNRICSIDGCGRPHMARGWCHKHYKRWKRHGHPNAVQSIHGDDVARFWAKVDKDGPMPESGTLAHERGLGACWLWTDPLDSDGYGNLNIRKHWRKAHHLSYEWLVGTIPEGLVSDHLCRVRHCVNPEHLEPVTSQENTLRGETIAARNANATHCIRDHEFTAENTRIEAGGQRHCRTCARERARKTVVVA